LQNIKEGMTGKPVDWYSDVFEVVFPDVDVEQANNVWKEKLMKPKDEEKD